MKVGSFPPGAEDSTGPDALASEIEDSRADPGMLGHTKNKFRGLVPGGECRSPGVALRRLTRA